MGYTEYFFDSESIRLIVQERRANLLSNHGRSDMLNFVIGVIAGRLEKDRLSYRDYGPYWFALKNVMNRVGDYDLGDQSDPLIAAAYRGQSDIETLVMADEFRTEYLRTQLIHTNQFMLDGESGEFWTLFDYDMESPKASQ